MPTHHDYNLTARVANASDSMDLLFEDHVIVGPGGDWYSLSGHKELDGRPKARARADPAARPGQ